MGVGGRLGQIKGIYHVVMGVDNDEKKWQGRGKPARSGEGKKDGKEEIAKKDEVSGCKWM